VKIETRLPPGRESSRLRAPESFTGSFAGSLEVIVDVRPSEAQTFADLHRAKLAVANEPVDGPPADVEIRREFVDCPERLVD